MFELDGLIDETCCLVCGSAYLGSTQEVYLQNHDEGAYTSY